MAAHAGMAWRAHQQGFGPQFVGQYSAFTNLLRYELSREIEKVWPSRTQPTAAAAPAERATAPTVQPPEPVASDARDARLGRPKLGDIWKAERPRDRYFGACLYYPVFWSSVFLAGASALLLVSVLRGDAAGKERALVVLTTTGCSLALFPQYFFFRPDAPHLSEFMVPFLPAVACSSWCAWQTARGVRSRFQRGLLALLILLSVALVPVYLKAIMPREDAGTIFRLDQPTEFRALNGVEVLLSARDVPAMTGLRDAVLAHSDPGEFVLVYPYAPTINFMTDRPSYEYNLYVDDSASGDSFQDEARERIDEKRPAVIVIDNRPINRTERSRFKNWATDLMGHITLNYKMVGSFQIGRREVEVYARPDKIRQQDLPSQTPAQHTAP
ncbi:MAG: hypothetical protein JHD33_06755 [Chthoniobacterales bacterium]|nr:hypothetical protein [Chthoniobacterales bacterium]